MNKIIQNSLFGITPSFYLRQLLIISVLFAAPIILVALVSKDQFNPLKLILSVTPAVLFFPYARVGLKSIIEYLQGGNILIYNILWKLVSVVISAMFWFILAPVGLYYLYRVNTRAAELTFSDNSPH